LRRPLWRLEFTRGASCKGLLEHFAFVGLRSQELHFRVVVGTGYQRKWIRVWQNLSTRKEHSRPGAIVDVAPSQSMPMSEDPHLLSSWVHLKNKWQKQTSKFNERACLSHTASKRGHSSRALLHCFGRGQTQENFAQGRLLQSQESLIQNHGRRMKQCTIGEV
jgi:hypothetical protein